MAWLYGAICAFDFILFPILHAIASAAFGWTYEEWKPMTVQGGGVVHFAFGAILGVAAYGHSQERVAILGGTDPPLPPVAPSVPPVKPTPAPNARAD